LADYFETVSARKNPPIAVQLLAAHHDVATRQLTTCDFMIKNQRFCW